MNIGRKSWQENLLFCINIELRLFFKNLKKVPVIVGIRGRKKIEGLFSG